MNILDQKQVFQKLSSLNDIRKFGAMYSSLYGGIVKDPALMVIPMDEHLVHRGDGVFEAIRFNEKSIYLLKPHLDRLYVSAEKIDLKMPISKGELENICLEVRKHSEIKVGMLRLYIGRGPGDFSANPYSTIGSQIYVIATDFKPMSQEKYSRGVSIMCSQIPVKPSPYSQIKSCNYLQNVLMKKESIDESVDFSIGVTDKGLIAEGSTENIMIFTKNGELCAPKFDYTLRGTTLLRAMELARKAQNQYKISKIEVRDISVLQMYDAQEIMMVGTTLAVLPVTRIKKGSEFISIGDGRPGPLSGELNRLVLEDMSE